MKKTLLILSIFSYSIVNGAMFGHNTDIPKSYEFDSDVRKTNEQLAAKLQRFQDGRATGEEIEQYLDSNESSTLYEKGVLITYTPQQMKALSITPQDIEGMVKKEDDGFFVSVYNSLFGSDDANATTASEVVQDSNTTESKGWFSSMYGSVFGSDEVKEEKAAPLKEEDAAAAQEAAATEQEVLQQDTAQESVTPEQEAITEETPVEDVVQEEAAVAEEETPVEEVIQEEAPVVEEETPVQEEVTSEDVQTEQQSPEGEKNEL